MSWQPFTELQKGETVGFVLALIPGVRVVAVFYQPDGYWYSSLHIRRLRFSNHVKSTTEADAKARAIEQAATFHNELTAALVGLGSKELPS